jgi:hypothetical protein
MNCTKCNFQNKENAKFCRNCGEKLTQNERIVENPSTCDLDTELLKFLSEDPTPVQLENAVQFYCNTTGYNNIQAQKYINTLWHNNFITASQEKRRKNKKVMTIFSVILTTILFIVSLLIFVTNNDVYNIIGIIATNFLVYYALIMLAAFLFYKQSLSVFWKKATPDQIKAIKKNNKKGFRFSIVFCVLLFLILGLAAAIKNKNDVVDFYYNIFPNKTGSLTWYINDGTLIIDGSGTMPNYDITPWDTEKNEIVKVRVGGYYNSNITHIGDNAFNGCKSLNSIYIDYDTKSIGDYAFKDCKNLTSIDLNGITRIGDYAFENCKNLQSVKFDRNIDEIQNIVFGKNVFKGCNDDLVLVFKDAEKINLSNFRKK